MIKFSFFCMFLSFFSCVKIKPLASPDYVLNPNAIDTNKLRFDGFYTMINKKFPKSVYKSESEVIFKKDNTIYHAFGASTSNEVFTCEKYKKIKADKLGIYVIENNTIRAFIPTVVTQGDGARYLLYNLNYIGNINNNESITNWHAVAPFPKNFGSSIFNSFQNKETFEPQELKFVKADGVSCLKSK